MASTKPPFHKLVIVGGGAVGKTALVFQLLTGKFTDAYDPTIEDSYRKRVLIDHQPCIIEILDTAGQEEYSAVREQYMKSGEGFIVVYSVTSRQSFEEASTFYKQIIRVRAGEGSGTDAMARSPIICLVANKADLTHDREVSAREGFALAEELGCMFVEASAKDCINVERAFFDAVRLMREQRQVHNHSEEQSIIAAIKELQTKVNYGSAPKSRRSSMLSISSWRRSSTPHRPAVKSSLSIVQQAAIDQLLVQVARRDEHKTAKQLLEMGADPDNPSVLDGSALYASVSIGHEQMVRLLLKSGASVNALGLADQSCLHAACLDGHVSLIELLIDQGANIEAHSHKYGTPLLAAAARGQVAAARAMLQRRANVNATGGVYGNALQAASWVGNVELAKVLLDNGANVHARGDGDCTAVQVAAAAGKHEIVRLLLLRRANIHDPRGKYGSPLRAASVNSHFDVMKLLYEFGAKEEELGSAVHGANKLMAATNSQQPPQKQSAAGTATAELRTETPQHTNIAADPLQPMREKSMQWLNTIAESDFNREVVLMYSSKLRKTKAPVRVKVAVLDTGCDTDAAFFSPPRTDRIKGWKDFADGSVVAVDEHGHGTHVVSLLMKIAPYADIYIARVARNIDDLSTASESIAKAILWAAMEWRVDVVSMSFGFSREVLVDDEPVISNAILKAVHDRWGFILFFAAAANYGGNQKEMFPACHRLVIPVRGTNALGVFEDFNPPPDPNGPVVFGTLGLEVPSGWLSTYDELVYKSGTSVATPIVAGIAAMLLSCASLSFADRVPSTPNPVKILWTRSGMSSILTQISTPMENRCFYVCPFAFIQKSDDERKATMIVATAKA